MSFRPVHFLDIRLGHAQLVLVSLQFAVAEPARDRNVVQRSLGVLHFMDVGEDVGHGLIFRIFDNLRFDRVR